MAVIRDKQVKCVSHSKPIMSEIVFMWKQNPFIESMNFESLLHGVQK